MKRIKAAALAVLMFLASVGSVLAEPLKPVTPTAEVAQAKAPVPPSLAVAEKEFKAAIAASGKNPKQCSVKTDKPWDGKADTAVYVFACADAPLRCYVLSETKPEGEPLMILGCEENPAYKQPKI